MQLLTDSERAAQELGILPVMGPETQPLVRDHEQTMQRLQSASGAEFDRMYVSHEIEMHKQVLETAASLAGQTQDPKLTMMVRNARPILEAHLHAAEQLLAEQR